MNYSDECSHFWGVGKAAATAAQTLWRAEEDSRTPKPGGISWLAIGDFGVGECYRLSPESRYGNRLLSACRATRPAADYFRQGPWNVDLRTPPGQECSNGSLLCIRRGHPGILIYDFRFTIYERPFKMSWLWKHIPANVTFASPRQSRDISD